MFDVNPSLIRFWEKKFDVLRPKKNAKGNRLFTPEDVENLKIIYHLVKERGMTLSGAEKYMKDNRLQLKHDVEIVEILQRMRSMLVDIRTELDSEVKQAAGEIIIRPQPTETDEPDALISEAIRESASSEEILRKAGIETAEYFLEAAPQEANVSREEEERVAGEFSAAQTPEPVAELVAAQEDPVTAVAFRIEEPAATPDDALAGFQSRGQQAMSELASADIITEPILPLTAAQSEETEPAAMPEAKPKYVELSLFDF